MVANSPGLLNLPMFVFSMKNKRMAQKYVEMIYALKGNRNPLSSNTSYHHMVEDI
jgi:hypothetical protein